MKKKLYNTVSVAKHLVNNENKEVAKTLRLVQVFIQLNWDKFMMFGNGIRIHCSDDSIIVYTQCSKRLCVRKWKYIKQYCCLSLLIEKATEREI